MSSAGRRGGQLSTAFSPLFSFRAMLPNLSAIETAAGRIALGATVRSTRYPVQGSVTAICWNGHHYCL